MNLKQERKIKLIELVKKVIDEQPFERGGYKWAALHLDEWTTLTGCSERTLRTYFGEAPFYSEQACDTDVKRLKIIRVLNPGEPPRKTPQRIANEMRRIWGSRKVDHVSIEHAKETGKPWKLGGKLKDDGKFVVSSEEHGCLIGLAEVWPDGHQHEILKCVLGNWTGFMVYAKQGAAAEQDAKTLDPNLPVEGTLFWQYPRMSVIRRFHQAAVELYSDTLQQGMKLNKLAA